MDEAGAARRGGVPHLEVGEDERSADLERRRVAPDGEARRSLARQRLDDRAAASGGPIPRQLDLPGAELEQGGGVVPLDPRAEREPPGPREAGGELAERPGAARASAGKGQRPGQAQAEAALPVPRRLDGEVEIPRRARDLLAPSGEPQFDGPRPLQRELQQPLVSPGGEPRRREAGRQRLDQPFVGEVGDGGREQRVRFEPHLGRDRGDDLVPRGVRSGAGEEERPPRRARRGGQGPARGEVVEQRFDQPALGRRRSRRRAAVRQRPAGRADRRAPRREQARDPRLVRFAEVVRNEDAVPHGERGGGSHEAAAAARPAAAIRLSAPAAPNVGEVASA